VVTGGMGGMGGAQPLAATLNGAALLCVEADPERIKRRLKTAYCDIMVNSLDEALRILRHAVHQKSAVSVAWWGTAPRSCPKWSGAASCPTCSPTRPARTIRFNGYIPRRAFGRASRRVAPREPREYLDRSLDSIAAHVRAMLELQRLGAVVFDYGNNIRAWPPAGVLRTPSSIPGFVPEYIRPMFCEGRGPSAGWRFRASLRISPPPTRWSAACSPTTKC